MKQKTHAAGIAIVKDDKLLLVHPTNGSWQKPVMSIPKGRIDPGENTEAAAKRETLEEVGIKIKKKKLGTVHECQNADGRILYYYIVRINDYSEIGLDSKKVPKNQLQSEEIDWAGFIKFTDCHKHITRYQMSIVNKLIGMYLHTESYDHFQEKLF